MIAIYARQSVERENSVSIETQIDFCKAIIKPDEIEKDILIYVDQGASGGNTNRDGFLKMMADIRQGKIKKVITYKLDRISRSLNDFVGILKIFKENSVEFVSSQESFDTSSIYGDLILKILIVFAEFERTSIINRVKDAYAKRTDMGLYMGGRRQYGFRLVKSNINGIETKIYEPIKKEIEQIIYIYEVYSQKNCSLRQLLNNLVKNNITPLNGSNWSTSKLSTIIKNPVYVKADNDVYCYYEKKGVKIINNIMDFKGKKAAYLYGKTTHNRDLLDWSDMKLVLSSHEGIIPSDMWLMCQKKLEKNKQIGNTISNKTSWLSGKLICSKCGYTMTTVKSPKKNGEYRRYFICTGKSHKKICDGIKKTIYADEIEYIVNDFIAEKLVEIGAINKSYYNENQSYKNNLKLNLTKIEQQQKKLCEIAFTKDINEDFLNLLNNKASKLNQQKNIILKKLNLLNNSAYVNEETIPVYQLWKTSEYLQKKAVANTLIYKIIVYNNGDLEIVWYI